jgi:hypothetical protein
MRDWYPRYSAKSLDPDLTNKRPQLKQVWPKAASVVGGAGRHITGEGGGRPLGAAR